MSSKVTTASTQKSPNNALAIALMDEPLIDSYAKRIRAKLSNAAEQVIEIGREFADARRTLDDEAFAELCYRLDCSNRATISKWVAIGNRYQRYKDVAGHLPSSWTTLYELSKLGDDEFACAVCDGRIHIYMLRPSPADLKLLKQPIPSQLRGSSNGGTACSVSTTGNKTSKTTPKQSDVVTITLRFDPAADRAPVMVYVKQVCEHLKRLGGVRVNYNAVTEIDPNQTANAA